MKQLTRCVLRQAARQQRSWRQQGLDVKTAVNLSVANLLDSDFPEIVSETLEAEGLPADWLELEVTESAAMVDPERSAQVLERLAATGIDLAIDDFGAGQSSLAYLRRLPVGSLKIDRSFVKHLAVDERDAEIVCSTIKLGQALGLRVVAEGVEDPKALSILQEHGCDLVQGFLFGKPALPGVMFEELRRFQSSRAGRVRSPGDPARPQREILRSPVSRAARSHLA